MASIIVPATPGFELVYCFFSQLDKEQEPTPDFVLLPTNRTPIIAWRVVESLYEEAPPEVLPVVLYRDVVKLYMNGEAGDAAILRPDGVVVQPENREWMDVRSWASHVLERWRARQTEEATVC
jgi:hypothetical protein